MVNSSYVLNFNNTRCKENRINNHEINNKKSILNSINSKVILAISETSSSETKANFDFWVEPMIDKTGYENVYRKMWKGSDLQIESGEEMELQFSDEFVVPLRKSLSESLQEYTQKFTLEGNTLLIERDRFAGGNFKVIKRAKLLLGNKAIDTVFAKFNSIARNSQIFVERETHILRQVKSHYPNGHRGLATALGECKWTAKSNQQRYGFVLPYLNGGTLEQTITSQSEFHKVCLDAAYGLKALHRIGILHNDLNTENICLMQDPITQKITGGKIIDFGLSTDQTNENHNIVLLVNDGVGSPELCQHPEQVNQLTGQSDIYSLGIICKSRLMGKTWELDKCILRMLANNPEDRPSIDEVIENLEKAIQ